MISCKRLRRQICRVKIYWIQNQNQAFAYLVSNSAEFAYFSQRVKSSEPEAENVRCCWIIVKRFVTTKFKIGVFSKKGIKILIYVTE